MGSDDWIEEQQSLNDIADGIEIIVNGFVAIMEKMDTMNRNLTSIVNILVDHWNIDPRLVDI